MTVKKSRLFELVVLFFGLLILAASLTLYEILEECTLCEERCPVVLGEVIYYSSDINSSNDYNVSGVGELNTYTYTT